MAQEQGAGGYSTPCHGPWLAANYCVYPPVNLFCVGRLGSCRLEEVETDLATLVEGCFAEPQERLLGPEPCLEALGRVLRERGLPGKWEPVFGGWAWRGVEGKEFAVYVPYGETKGRYWCSTG